MINQNINSADRELLEKQINDVFNLFRNEGIPISERYSFIFLLYLYNEKLLDIDVLFNGNYLNSGKSECLIDKKYSRDIMELIPFYLSNLQVFSRGRGDIDNFLLIKTINGIVAIFDKALLSKHFAFVFEFMLNVNTISNGRYEEVSVQPKELTEFINSFIGNVDGLNVFNPFAGGASFIKDYKGAKYILAQEDNIKSWALGKLRLLVHGVECDLRCENVLENWPNDNQENDLFENRINENPKFDLIVSHPPFHSLKDRDIKGKLINRYSSAEQFIIEKGLDLLTPKGKIILVVPFGFLSPKGGTEHIIHNLLERDLIDTIVNFPSGLLYGTGIKISIVVLNKVKEIPNQIKFVDASEFIEEKNKFQKKIIVQKLLVAIKTNAIQAVRNINKFVIQENGNDLNYQRYFTDINDFRSEKNSKVISLSEILISVPKTREKSSIGKVIKIADLSSDKFNYEVDIDSLNEAEIDRSYYQLNQPALLIAKTFNRLKPSYCESSVENSVYVSQNIEAFTCSSNEIELPYLIMQLNSEFIQKQLEINSNAAVYPNLKVSDILNLKIEIPNLKVQDSKIRQIALIEGAKLQADRDNIEKLQLQNTIDKLVQERLNDFQWALHDLRNGALLSITNKTSILQKLSKKDKRMEDIVIDDTRGINVKTLINSLSDNVKRLVKDLAEMFDYSEDFGKKQKVNILNFINNFIENQEFLNKNNFILDCESLLSIPEEILIENKILNVDFNVKDLTRIFENIFENIKRHAGFDENKVENKIKILLSIVDDEVYLSVLNSGKINKINKSDYFSNGGRSGENANSGKGGYIIKILTERNNSKGFQNTYEVDEAMGYVFEVGFKTKYYLDEQESITD